MRHLFKVELERSDLFIESLDNDFIVYEVRDKESGKLLEPKHRSKVEFGGDRILFDNRHLMMGLANVVFGTLNEGNPLPLHKSVN